MLPRCHERAHHASCAVSLLAGRPQVLRTKGPIGDMLPANSPPTNGKASHKRKAPASADSAAQPAAAQPSGEAEPADAKAEEHATARKPVAVKRQGAARKAPAKRGKVSESGQADPQRLEPAATASQAAVDGLPEAEALLVVVPAATDAGPAGGDDAALALPNGHASDGAKPDAAPLAAATGPGEGVPPAAAAQLPCKKKGGWPKGKPRRNHVPTGKVRFCSGTAPLPTVSCYLRVCLKLPLRLKMTEPSVRPECYWSEHYVQSSGGRPGPR